MNLSFTPSKANLIVKPHPLIIWLGAIIFAIGLSACKSNNDWVIANQTSSYQPMTSPATSQAAIPTLSLDCPSPRQEMALDEIHVFTMTLRYTPPIQPDFEAVLETVDGEGWEATLCFGQQCFLHDGVTPLHRLVTVKSPGYLEVSILVPAEALAGASKTLRLTMISKNYPARTSIEVTGYLP